MIKRILPLLALFTRSLRDDLRSKFPPIMRALAVVFVLLLIWGNQRSMEQSAPGQQLLMMLAMVNIVGATIVGLGSFSSAITEEKEEETIGLLLMTRLNPLAILLGKSTARLAGGLLFIVVQIPFTMLCVTLGGVTVDQVLEVYAILAAYLTFLCNLCLLWSVLSRRTALAVALTFVTGLLLYVLPFVAAASFYSRAFMGRSGAGDPMEDAIKYMMGASPIMDTLNAIYLNSGLPFPTHSVPFHLIGAGVLFCLSWMLFNKFCSAGGEIAPKRAKKTGGVAWHGRFPRPWRRALAWKDFHFLTGGVRGMMLRSAIYTVLVGGVLVWASELTNRLSQRSAGMIVMWCGIVIFVAELGGLAGRVFGTERKNQTLGGLVGLPIATSRLILHKVVGCFPAFIPSLAIAAFGWLMVSTAIQSSRYSRVDEEEFAFYILVVAEMVFFPVMVAWLSLRMRRAPLLTGIGIMLFGNIFAVVLGEMFFDDRGDSLTWMWLLTLGALGGAALLAASLPRRVQACAAEE